MLILKNEPKDFYVEEILPKKFLDDFDDSSKVYLYKVKKTNMSNTDLENELKKYFKYYNTSGIKDKLAITVQYLTSNEFVDNFLNLDQRLEISFVKRINKHLYIGAHSENYFVIKTNDFKDYKKFAYIGTPNYFDTQRFLDNSYLEFSNAYLKKDYEKALKYHFKRDTKNLENNLIKLDIINNWNHIDNINKNTLEYFNKNQYKKVILECIRNKNWEYAIRQLNKKDVKRSLMQYQSYLWNEFLKKIIKKYDYIEFENLYYNKSKIKNLELPLFSNQNYKTFNDEFNLVLKENNLIKEDLNLYNELFKDAKRELFFFAKDLNKKKDILSFRLNKGCYATIFIKHLYSINYFS